MARFRIGANVGYFTLLGSILVGDSGRVMAVEPVSINAFAIGRQVEINEVGNGDIFRCASLLERFGYTVTPLEGFEHELAAHRGH